VNQVSSNEGQRTLDGTVRSFLAESLIVPVGLIATVILTRRLGADGYGLYTLTVSLVAWIEWTITAVFSRATYKCVGEVSDWRPVGAAVVRLHLVISVVSAVLVAALAGPIATMLGEPSLAGYLRLYAIDIPIFSLTHAHRSILIGTGGFRQRAVLGAVRWMVRLVLVVLLVGVLGFSIRGAILTCIGTSLAELAMARRFIKPSLFGSADFPVRRLWEAAVPLFLSAMSLRLFDKLDLFMLKTLGATAAQAGVYGIAQNLTMVTGIFSVSFSPLLLSTLTRLLRDGHPEHARLMARDSMRLILLLLPLAGLAAGSADEIVRLVAGPKFDGAGPLVALLIFETVTGTLYSVANSILTVGGKAKWTFWIAGPLVPLAALGHLVMIPRFGAFGAATVTTALSVGAAAVTLGAIWQMWRVAPPVASLARSVLLCAGAFALASLWPTAGVMLVMKLAVISVLVVIGYLVLGEFSGREIALAWSLVPGRKR
jgi:O-antigen/teichoic acid export membrane protein